MKRAISLILILVLCLSLCACGSNGGSNESLVETSIETTVETDPLAFLYGKWVKNDFYFEVIGLSLEENGVGYGAAREDISWTFSNDILTISGAMISGSFKHLNSNGYDYLVGEEYTFVRQDDLDVIPTTTIELTVDNWKDYFEIQVYTTEIKDQFGDLTGEVETTAFLKVKEYNRFVCVAGEDALIRYSQGGKTIDGAIQGGTSKLYNYSEDLTIDQIEMIRIEGKITYLDGI